MCAVHNNTKPKRSSFLWVINTSCQSWYSIFFLLSCTLDIATSLWLAKLRRIFIWMEAWAEHNTVHTENKLSEYNELDIKSVFWMWQQRMSERIDREEMIGPSVLVKPVRQSRQQTWWISWRRTTVFLGVMNYIRFVTVCRYLFIHIQFLILVERTFQ